jgi:catechol 2,3-dioxygenase-like lactoylglutathione lyase family enzyme
MQAEFFGIAPLLQVYDMPSALRFYRDVLGFELINQSHDGEEFDWCPLARGRAELMLNTMYQREGHGRSDGADC